MTQYHPSIQIIDSHTGGEPTRLVIAGGPDLGSGSLAEQRERFSTHFDALRAGIINEPRGSDVVVGALLCEPENPACSAGVIFFNNVGMLNMCGHGTIGLLVTLAHMGRIGPGEHRIETPVGEVTATLLDDHRVKLRNVPSYRAAKQVALEVESVGTVHGDIAWGGNWFFLVEDHGLPIAMRHLDALSDTAWRIRQALERAGITGDDGEEIDHIELFGPPSHPDAHSKSFVLCPGKAYDRSPCGTGTSAKLACLAADGKLAPGETWVQESVVGSTFEGQVEIVGDLLYPIITGSAWVSAESTLIFHPNDPFRKGIPSP